MKAKKKSACDKNPSWTLALFRKGLSLTKIGAIVGTNKRCVREFLVRCWAIKPEDVRKWFPYSRPGSEHPEWGGGRIVDKDGYVLVYRPEHPHRRKHLPYVFEHRAVMEKHLGRFLKPGEVVHHKNGKKADNRIENLELFQRNSDHLRHELSGRVPKWTKDGLRRIRAGIDRSATTRRSRTLARLKPGVQP